MKKMSVKTNKIIQNVVRVLLLFVISLIIGITVYSFNVKSLKGDQMPMPFKIGISVVLTGSMEPTIKAGEVIIIHEQDEYEIGDILTYRENGILVTHRIIDKTQTTYTTRGDANNTNDPAISKKAAVGKTIFHIPYIGTFILFIQTPIGLFCVLAILIGLKVMYTLLRTQKENLEI